MMDITRIIHTYKSPGVGGMSPRQMASLFDDLRLSGLSENKVDENFYKIIIAELFPSIKDELKIHLVTDLEFFVTNALAEPVPEEAAVVIATPEKKAAMIAENAAEEKKASTTKVDDEYDEYDDTDPLFTPESERISIDPSKLPDMETDWDFIEKLGGIHENDGWKKAKS